MRVILLCHAETAVTASATFPGAESLSERGHAQAARVDAPRADLVLRAPSPQCAETAQALGVPAVGEPALAGCDHGVWRGRQLDEILTTEREALTRWLTDPAAAPHGGESITALIRRAGIWLDGLSGANTILAVADQTFIRATLVHAIDAKPATYWRIDISPLHRVELTGQAGRWHLRAGTGLAS